MLLGAVGDPAFDHLPRAEKIETGLLALRKGLGVYANLRPAKAFAALHDVLPFKPERVAGADLVIVRELLGGLYFGEPRGLAADGSEGFNTMRYTPAEVERVQQVRLRHRARAPPQGALGRQGQRPRDVAALARDDHQGGAGVSRRHARAPVRRRVRDEPGARSAPLRRRGHREPVRRHPVGRSRRHRRLARHAAVGEPRRRARPLRTDPRLGADAGRARTSPTRSARSARSR